MRQRDGYRELRGGVQADEDRFDGRRRSRRTTNVANTLMAMLVTTAMSGEFRMEERKTGRGERAQGSANQQIRGCRVTMSLPERRIRLVG